MFSRRNNAPEQALEKNVKAFVDGFLSANGDPRKFSALNKALGSGVRGYITIKRKRNAAAAGAAAATVQQAGGTTRGAALAAMAAGSVPPAQAPEAVAQVLGETQTPPSQASVAIQNLISLQNRNLNTPNKRTLQARRLLETYQRAFNKVNLYNRSKLSTLQGQTLNILYGMVRGVPKRPAPPPPTRVRQPGTSAPRLPAPEAFQRLLNETRKTTPPYRTSINGRNVYSTSSWSTNLYSKNPNGTYYKLKTNINGKLVPSSNNRSAYVYRNSRFQKKN